MSLPRKSGLVGVVAGVLVIGLATSALAQGGPQRSGPGSDGDRPAFGRDGGPGGHSRFSARQLAILDTNGDGVLSQEEIAAEHGRLLGAADVDGDGQLSADEFRRRGTFFIRLGTTTFFDLIDANGDQQISQEELNQPMGRWFVRKDTNNDGNIDAEEFSEGRRSFGRRHR
jgi:Ca2+-binding EF-hand superfamily protein